jgi:prevent-host-death family protein
MSQVPLDEARAHLDELVEAAMGGDEVIITKDSRPVVKLVGIPQGGAKPRFGSARGKIEMAEDFDAPLEDFRDYMR